MTGSYPFEFSVIMAVYNCEPYLKEAVDSLIAQDFGFDRIQLILVDDGSTDDSGSICDAYRASYPDNILVLHKENAGVACARNVGLQLACGRFLNFMDSDDRFSVNAFSRVYDFFTAHENDVDIVTTPLYFFDAKRGPHWQNRKFRRGTRIIDLREEYTATLMFVNASFFSARVKPMIDFDPRLVCSEDTKVILTLLADKMKFGVVTGCRYHYRRRANNSSLVQSSRHAYGWYFDYFTYLVDWALAYYQDQLGFVPDYVQYELLCDIQWRFRNTDYHPQSLSAQEIILYKQRLASTLRCFDDRFILEMNQVFREHRCKMLEYKYGCPPQLVPDGNDLLVKFGDTQVCAASQLYTRIEFLEIEGDELILEGQTKMVGVTAEEPLGVTIEYAGASYPCTLYERPKINAYCFGDELLMRGVAFFARIPLSRQQACGELRICLDCRGARVFKQNIRYGPFARLGLKKADVFYHVRPWAVRESGGVFLIERCSSLRSMQLEMRFLASLWKRKEQRKASRKAVGVRLVCHILKALKRRPILLLSDRITKADDNAEALFRYICKHHSRDVRAYFVLSDKCEDYHRLRRVGRVVSAQSRKHKLLHLLCDYNISSHADYATDNPFLNQADLYKDLRSHRFIFLQHGVTKDDLTGWINRFSKNIQGLVTSAEPEYESFVQGDYGYTPDVIWKTGMPRFDRLYTLNSRQITIMPTWRRYLCTQRDDVTGVWQSVESFAHTAFFTFYDALINHPRLLEQAQRLGYSLAFFPHPNLQPSLGLFHQAPGVRFLPLDTPYRDAYAQSSLVVTDYSSAAFDFAYMRKPVLYCHFDAEEFFSGNHAYQKGYFDYERDGFGEVEYDLEHTVDRIIEYMQHDCALKDVYRDRIDRFFLFDDQKNCERVYQKIVALRKKK